MPTWLLSLLGVGDPGGGLIGRILSFIPNPEEKAKAQLDFQKSVFEAAVAAESDQRKIDQVEAGSSSMFVAGWRPAVGWLCVVTLGYQWMIVPSMLWLTGVAGWHLPPLPALGSSDTQTLLYALLGIGTMRTLDKGVASITGTAASLTKRIKGMY